jgi:hypothetical protein
MVANMAYYICDHLRVVRQLADLWRDLAFDAITHFLQITGSLDARDRS